MSESLSSPIDECITGFVPRDTYTPAPTSIPSAREAFTPPQSGGGVEVDLLEHITPEELRAHHAYVEGIVHAQTIAEQELGINPRHPA
jgi:hypothetical protein